MRSVGLAKKIHDNAIPPMAGPVGFEHVKPGTIYTDTELVELCNDVVACEDALIHMRYNMKWNSVTGSFETKIRNHSQVEFLITTQTLKPHHLDILTQPCKNQAFILPTIFGLCQTLDEKYIDIGLECGYDEARTMAANHPCCPEAKKVAHLLKWGSE